MIIGFSGRARSGKSSAAEVFSEVLDAHINSFARCVYHAALGALLHTDEDYEDFKQREVRPGITGRDLLIAIGHGARQVNPEIWIKLFHVYECFDYTVIPDVRYVNEAEWILAQGGKVFFIESNRALEIATESEVGQVRQLPGVIVLENNADIGSFLQKVEHEAYKIESTIHG